jgi:hypothetical protein
MNLAAWSERLPVHLEWLSQLRAEWEGNSRLRRGLLAIWGLLLLYLVLVLSDATADRRGELIQLKTRLDRLEAIHAQRYWLERAQRSEAALADLQASFPLTPSSGRADAEIKSLLEAAVRESGSRKLRIAMTPTVAIQDGELWQVTGSVRGVVDGQTARDFVANLETRANHVRFRRLKLVRGLTADKVRVEVEVEAFYRAGAR